MAISLRNADKIKFKDGLITFESKEKFGKAIGWCYGLYPTVMTGTENYVYRHEVVHVVQNLQLMSSSYEPFIKTGSKKTAFRINGIRLQSLGVIADLSLSQFSYESNLKEIEAFHFASSTSN